VRKWLAGSLILAVFGALAGCGGDTTSDPAGASAAPSATSSTSSTPSPEPTALDEADLRKGLVTADDLGAPWIQPKSVATAGSKGEICPGHQSAAKKVLSDASAQADFTEGKGAGKNIATFRLSTVADEDASVLKAAYGKDDKTCAEYTDAGGLYVVRSEEGPQSVANADELVAGWSERVYYDKSHKKLAYARHYLVARTGQLVTYFSYAFLIDKVDPKAKDFSRASELLGVQLSKNAKVFS
jgi:hypothetical protein